MDRVGKYYADYSEVPRAQLELDKAFDPDQPRDEHGRWAIAAGLEGVDTKSSSFNQAREAAARGIFDMKVTSTREGYGSKTHEVSVIPKDIPPDWKTFDRWGEGKNLEYYDPKYAEPKTDKYGTMLGLKDVSSTAFNFPSEPGIIYRGMSNEEYEGAKKNGYFESKGGYNLGSAQEGLSYFSADPQTAVSYANGFAPWQYSATPSRPAVVVAIKDPGNHVIMPHIPEEIGLRGRVPFSALSHVYLGHPVLIRGGKFDVIDDKYRGTTVGSGVGYRASVRWERHDLAVSKAAPTVGQILKLAGKPYRVKAIYDSWDEAEIAKVFEEALHPRGAKGKFVESGLGTPSGEGAKAPGQAPGGELQVFLRGKTHEIPPPINGIGFSNYSPPSNWAKVEGQTELNEPPLETKVGYDKHHDEHYEKEPASGAVVEEPDGRVWLLRPKGGFGGYKTTFPKGRAEPGLSLQANAIKEVYEETGLKVKIVGHLGDHEGDVTNTRYYRAVRTGGNPNNYGKETASVILAPKRLLHTMLNRSRDKKIAASLNKGYVFDPAWIEKEFNEALHPRDAKGKFAAAYGGHYLEGSTAQESHDLTVNSILNKPALLGIHYRRAVARLLKDSVKFGTSKLDQSYLKNKLITSWEMAYNKALKTGKTEQAGKIATKLLSLGYSVHDSPADQLKTLESIATPKPNFAEHIASINAAAIAANPPKLPVSPAQQLHPLEQPAKQPPKYVGEVNGKPVDQYGNEYKPVVNIKSPPEEVVNAAQQAQQVHQLTAPQGEPLKMSQLTKVGDKLGSNQGGTYRDKEGNQFYVKEGKTADHVKNELAAAALFRLAGGNTLTYRPVEGGTHTATALEKLDKNNVHQFTDAERAQAQKDFAVHAWLANWDSVGTGGDNLAIKDGKVTSLDFGGSLLYRAQGGEKGAFFGSAATEMETMRMGSKNPDAVGLYGKMTPEQVAESAKHVTSISDEAIKQTVAQYFGKDYLTTSVADKLIARRDYIASNYDTDKLKAKAEIEAKQQAEAKVKAEAYAQEQKVNAAKEAKEFEHISSALGLSGTDAKVNVESFKSLASMMGKSPDELIKDFKAEKDIAGTTLSKFEIAMIRAYTGSSYGSVNSALRAGVWTPQQHMFVNTVNKALKKLPTIEGTTRRTISMNADTRNKTYKEGYIVEERAFTSTSKKPGWDFGGNTLLMVTGKSGRDLQSTGLSSHPGEGEVLYPARTFFLVTKVDHSTHKPTIHLQEVEAH